MLMGRNDPQDYFSHFEWDNSTYQAIADVGNTIIGTCMQFTGISTQWHRGGMEKAGHRRSMALVYYSWGSEVDANITRILRQKRPLIWDYVHNVISEQGYAVLPVLNNNYAFYEDNGGGNAGGIAGGYAGVYTGRNAGSNAAGNAGGSAGGQPANSGASSGSVNNYGGEVTAPGNQYAAPELAANGILPFCGQACYGNVNSCDPLSGCSCIAKRLSNARGTSFFSTCGVAYTSAGTRGRVLLDMDGNNTLMNLGALGPGSTFVYAADVSRLDDSACPCNCTYESPSLKLGAVEMRKGVLCNTTSGLPQNSTDGTIIAGLPQKETKTSAGLIKSTANDTSPTDSTDNSE
ncbi:MAG: hypothetical protein Q9202_006447 [Teloschistes flavicans]